MTKRQPAYVLLTDAPPLAEGGHGCHVLVWNWLAAMQERVKLVITHRFNPALELDRIAETIPVSCLFYPDLSRVRWPRMARALKSLCEAALVYLESRRLFKAMRAAGAERIFAFFGGNAWFLCVTAIVARKSKLPLDVYLVDDLEESCHLNGEPFLARFVRWLEPRVLRRAERVFVISSGYGDHIHAKYGINAEWLPIPFRDQKLVYVPYKQKSPDIRTVAYIGAVNALYLSAVKEFLEVVADWNKTAAPFKVKLLLLRACFKNAA
jgi:hypothetical protein